MDGTVAYNHHFQPTAPVAPLLTRPTEVARYCDLHFAPRLK